MPDIDPVALRGRAGGPGPYGRVYVDGSALARYLDGSPCHKEWMAWVRGRERQLVVTPLGLSDLRGEARLRDAQARRQADQIAERLEVVGFSDQTLREASRVTGVLPAFVALHVGAARTYPDVTAVATYDPALARVAALYGLQVVSPGLSDGWWEDDPAPW